MKYLRQALRVLIVSIVLASSLVVLAPNSFGNNTASALTAKECRAKYDGKGYGNAIPEEDRVDQAKYESSKCSYKDGGLCVSESIGSGGVGLTKIGWTISCSDGAIMEVCYQFYDGKGTGSDSVDDAKLTKSEYDAFKKTSCSTDKNGPCTVADSGGGVIIDCTRPSSVPDPEDKSLDSETGIGNDFDPKDCSAGTDKLTADNCEVIGIIVLITNVLSGLAATVIVAMIIVGGIQYSMAGAEPAKVQAAKHKITNALLALMLLIFGFSIIQWLVPGGLI